jgi:hypothetical protein
MRFLVPASEFGNQHIGTRRAKKAPFSHGSIDTRNMRTGPREALSLACAKDELLLYRSNKRLVNKPMQHPVIQTQGETAWVARVALTPTLGCQKL